MWAAVSGAGGWWSTRGGRTWALDLDPGGESVTARPLTLDDLARDAGGARPAPLDPVATGRSLRDIQAAAADIATGRPIDTRGLGEPPTPTLESGRAGRETVARNPGRVIDESRQLDEPLSALALRAVENRQLGGRWALGRINDRASALVNRLLGNARRRYGTPAIDVTGFEFNVDAAELRKNVDTHVGENEKDGRNLPLRPEDFDLIPSILAEPDKIGISRAGGDRREPSVEFVKRLDDDFVAVVEVRANNGELAVISFQRKPVGDGEGGDGSGGPAGGPSPGGAGPERPRNPVGNARGTHPELRQDTASSENGAAGAGPQPDAGANGAEAPDGVPESIDHPAAHGEDAAAEALATPEIDHIGRAVENARRPRRSAAGEPDLPEGFERADPANPRSISNRVRRALASIREGVAGGRMTLVGHRVTAGEAAIVREKAGEDIDGFTHIIERSAVRHVESKHGPDSPDARNGGVPVVPEDYDRIPEVLAAPDDITRTRTARGAEALTYEKRMPDGTWLYVEQVRVGRRTLALATFYKIRRRGEKGGVSEVPDPYRDAATQGKRPKPPPVRSSSDNGDAAPADQAHGPGSGAEAPDGAPMGDREGIDAIDALPETADEGVAPRSLDSDPDIAAFQAALEAGEIGAEEARAFARADAELVRMARLEEAYDMATMCVLRGRG